LIKRGCSAKGLKGTYPSNNSKSKFKRGSTHLLMFFPFPLIRGRGLKGDGVIQIKRG
jgi:hypothetical protein